MRFFNEEDNKNLYESELPDVLKNYIANFNEIIICYIKEKFEDNDKLDDFLNEIKEKYKKVTYELDKDPYSDAYASYNYIFEKFTINKKALDLFSIEQGLLAIYFHEFSHFLSSIKNQKTTTRIEEGIADLFSDELVEYFNKSFAEKEIIDKKASTYKISSSTIRNACLINNNIKDLLWNYYNSNKKELNDFFANAYGEEATKLMFDIEKYSNNHSYMLEKEKEYIQQALKDKDIINAKEIYIRLNTVLQDAICKQLLEKSISLEEAQEKYKNIPKEFFDDYKIMFSSINVDKEEIIKKEEINESELENLAENFLKFANIEQYQNPNNKTGLNNRIELDFILNFIKYKNIFNMDMSTILPLIYAYKCKYNNIQYKTEDLKNITSEFGLCDRINKKTIDRMLTIGEKVNQKFSNLTTEQCFEEIKKAIKKQIKDLTKIDFYKTKLKDKKININEFIDSLKKEYKNSEKDEIYEPTQYIIQIIQEYAKSQQENLNLETFEKTKNNLEQEINELNAPYIPSITGNILYTWDIDKTSVYDTEEILSKYNIETNIPNTNFEDIRIKNIIEISKENDINNIIKYIHITSNNRNDNAPYLYRKRGRMVTEIESIKNIKEIVYEKIKEASKNNNEILKQKVENNDRDLIKFYQYRSLKPLTEDDKKIIQQITGIEKDSDKPTDYFEYKFNEEIYNKLKEYPHLALTYIANYQPHASLSMVDTWSIFQSYNNSTYPYLKQQNKDLFIELVTEINKSYEPAPYDKNITYEINLLSQYPYGMLDEQTQKQFIEELLNVCNKKIDILTTETIEDSKKELLQQEIQKNIERGIKNTNSEYIKQSLNNMYNKMQETKNNTK